MPASLPSHARAGRPAARASSLVRASPRAPARSPLRLLSVVGLLLAATLAAAPAEAIKVQAPDYVLQDKVPFVFTDADAGSKVILHVGSRVYQRTVSVATFNITAENVTAGFTHWVANTTLGAVSSQVDGYVYVDSGLKDVQSRLGGMSTDMGKMQGDLGRVHGDLGRINGSVSADRNATLRLANNVTQLRRQVGNGSAAAAVPVPRGNATQLAAPSAAEVAATRALAATQRMALYILGAVVILLGGLAVVLWQMKRRSQEQMLVLLAVASHDGITPSSPEYQKALEAIGGKPKPAKKPKKAKA